MGLGNIQISEVYAYMRMFRITDMGLRAAFLERIQFMDGVYLQYQNEKMEEKRRKSKAQKGRGR